MKKLICLILGLCISFGMFSCDKTINDGEINRHENIENKNLKVYDLKNIVYRKTQSAQEKHTEEVGITMYPLSEFIVGDNVQITINVNNVFYDNNAYYYVVVDWGDGVWSYNGPYRNSAEDRALAFASHEYKKSGDYDVKACAVNLYDGKIYGWSKEIRCMVKGNEATGNMIKCLSPFVSSVKSGKPADILDGRSETYVKTKNAADSDQQEYIGLFFDDWYRLDSVEVQFPSEEITFPSNIALEYTTDGGRTWYSLPKYYYLYDYEKGRYMPIMRFPNPKGATVEFAADGIVANGIRISAKLFLEDARTFAVSEMRAYGDKKTLFYTSDGGYADADLNNMWTIFGKASTEPITSGTVFAGKTNVSPFRSGCAAILSTEWAEWNGLKFNWTDEENIKEAYLNQLINIRYGPDGWSGSDGYIYATADSPKHLDVQHHYTYNSIFIIAARNYILQGNNMYVIQNDKQIPFMEAKNRYGQTMLDKINKAMEYMLDILGGNSGLITVYDPENNGTPMGHSSNYWDAHRSFGYKSAYENALFYQSLKAMGDIEKYLGNDSDCLKYASLAQKCKDAYNNLFWDEAKGRYINSVNIHGERIDFGMTFVNFYAVLFGLADNVKAKLIYDWMDGKRIIRGDTSTGKDIYGEFVYAPRANTVDVSVNGAPYYWWDHGGRLPCEPGTFGGYGHQMQNGGTIFYISYYDMMGRLESVGAESAGKRFKVILDEFHRDSLRRNRYMPFMQNGTQGVGEYSEGVIGEFPESGLVPLTYVTGFLGINVSPDGLEIVPSLPGKYRYAGVREYHFGNRIYSIQVRKDITEPKIQYDDEKYFVVVPADKKYTITLDNRLMEK